MLKWSCLEVVDRLKMCGGETVEEPGKECVWFFKVQWKV